VAAHPAQIGCRNCYDVAWVAGPTFSVFGERRCMAGGIWWIADDKHVDITVIVAFAACGGAEQADEKRCR
jgi:hypothetical protein